MITASSIGIFGGRFDPVHRAHIAMAKAAADQLQLNEVLWVVSANAVHKAAVASAEHRLEMVRLALEELGDPRMKIDEREIRAAALGEANPSYKTLQSLKQERPDAQCVWIMGEDQLQAFTTWQRWEWLAQNMVLAACRRPGAGQANLPQLIAAGSQVVTLDFAADPVSSSQVRERLAGCLPIDDLVPQGVARYLAAHGVYGAAPTARRPNSV
jgi:nicotinate-nucleotide adenylyltransferase